MDNKHMQDIISLVNKPSRYLGTEINSITKSTGEYKLGIALAFPDAYEIGMSHLGIQILYHILNQRKDVLAERIFAPGIDLESELRKKGIPISSLESGTPLNQFDIIGFSLLYELNYTNILTLLDLSGIPFLSRDRNRSHPLIIAGGPCTCNPEPIADFFDAIVIGDGEDVILELVDAAIAWKEDNLLTRTDLFKTWDNLEGVYIPSFFRSETKSSEHDARFRTRTHETDREKRVKRRIVADLDKAPFPSSPIVPFGKPVHDRLRIEIARGCTRGCRFCQAGMIYRPVRERSVKTLLKQCAEGLKSTGYEDVSLLSLSSGDYSSIEALMAILMSRCESEKIAISLPSFRAGTLTPELMHLIRKVRKTGFTIAPEAGTQRLRNVINKNLTEADIIKTVQNAFDLGWNLIKLYFMIGLPTETVEDLQGIVDLVEKLRAMRGKGHRKFQINVSVGTYIPKPHTPFQWASQLSREEAMERMEWLNARLRLPGVRFSWRDPDVSLLEGVFSRGDRSLAKAVVSAFKKGARFDGWSDSFDMERWRETFGELGIDMDFFTTRKRDHEEPLPWDHIDIGVKKSFLLEEWEKTFKGTSTQDCRNGDCGGCGTCDFEHIQPVTYPFNRENTPGRDFGKPEDSNPGPDTSCPDERLWKTLEVSYSRRGPARFLGHLELVNVFSRSIRRAKILIKYSGGFHPLPKMAFHNPLPVGMESEREVFRIIVGPDTRPEYVRKELNRQLPAGLEILDCRTVPGKGKQMEPEATRFLISFQNRVIKETDLSRFMAADTVLFEKINRKGKRRSVDLKRIVKETHIVSDSQLSLLLKNEPGKTVRPMDVVRTIFAIKEEDLRQAVVLKKTGMEKSVEL